MFLTQIKMDTANPHTIYALGHRNAIHGAVRHSVKQEKTPLWRIDNIGGIPHLLVLSEEAPDLELLTSQFCKDVTMAKVARYGPLLERIEKGTRWRFRLVAHPRIRIRSLSKDPKTGKGVSCLTQEEQMEWLTKRQEEHGFMIDPDRTLITGKKWEKIERPKSSNGKNDSLRFLAVSYEGVLEVIDPEAFRTTLVSGMGQKKAYGMGMLSVAKELL